MKNLKTTLCITMLALVSVFGQQEKDDIFILSPEEVKIYDFNTSTSGLHYEYQFEDDYAVKVTNKVYKINLFFNEDQTEIVQETVSKILEGHNNSSGFKDMVWKKTDIEGQPVYKVEVRSKKLRIEAVRQRMDFRSYRALNHLGQEVINAISS